METESEQTGSLGIEEHSLSENEDGAVEFRPRMGWPARIFGVAVLILCVVVPIILLILMMVTETPQGKQDIPSDQPSSLTQPDAESSSVSQE